MKDKLYQLMDWPRIEGIVYSDEDRPEEILGVHPAGSSMLYQAFFPQADKVSLVLEDKKKKVAMERADEAGFFAALIGEKKAEPYHFEITESDGRVKKVKDPYAFRGALKKDELKLFKNGIHYELYRLLGSHADILDTVEGIRFVVWMPHAIRVSVVGEFNHFDGRVNPMSRIGDSDVFVLFIPGLETDITYQYEVKLSQNKIVLITDPFAEHVLDEDRQLSRPFSERAYSWNDENYLKKGSQQNNSIFLYTANEEELLQADTLARNLQQTGYSHVVLPATRPGESFYRFSTGFGRVYSVKEFVNTLHHAGIGVLLQWDIHGLNDLRIKEHSNFHIANVLYIVENYHLDGIVFSNMAAALYLDYGKEAGQWIPNIYGGNENLDAVEWIKHTNSILRKRNKGALLIANLDAIWPDVTQPLEEDGLGFDYRYDTDFTKDFLGYLINDPYFRSGIHDRITDRMLYAYRERFIMALGDPDCDDLWEKIMGTNEDKFRTLKLAHSYAMFLPGKLLSTLRIPASGKQNGQYQTAFMQLIKDSRTMNHSLSPLEAEDFRGDNFRWINCFQYNDCTVSFYREADNGEGVVLVIANFANAPKKDFHIGVPHEGKYKLFFHTENAAYLGNLKDEESVIYSDETEWDGYPQNISIDLAPLSLAAYIFIPYTEEELFEIAEKKAETIRLKLEEEARNKAKGLKKSTLKDTLSKQVEQARRAINEGSENKKKLESKRRRNGSN